MAAFSWAATLEQTEVGQVRRRSAGREIGFAAGDDAAGADIWRNRPTACLDQIGTLDDHGMHAVGRGNTSPMAATGEGSQELHRPPDPDSRGGDGGIEYVECAALLPKDLHELRDRGKRFWPTAT